MGLLLCALIGHGLKPAAVRMGEGGLEQPLLEQTAPTCLLCLVLLGKQDFEQSSDRLAESGFPSSAGK